MKKLIFTAALLFSCLSFKAATAQVSFSVGINIGSQPDWGPTGYDHVDYYYMPDIDAYYDVPAHQYVYYNNNVWVHSVNLPPRYANYDVYHGYKVVVNKPNPWVHNTVYRTRYAKYRNVRTQTIIRDSKEVKYKNHWNGHDNGNHNGWNKGHGNGNDQGHGHDDHGHGHGHGHHD